MDNMLDNIRHRISKTDDLLGCVDRYMTWTTLNNNEVTEKGTNGPPADPIDLFLSISTD